MVEAAADERAGRRAHTLGPLIHNPRVVAGLAARGRGRGGRARGGRRAARCCCGRTAPAPAEEGRAREALRARAGRHVPVREEGARGGRAALARGLSGSWWWGRPGHPEVEATLPHAPGAVVVGSAAEAEPRCRTRARWGSWCRPRPRRVAARRGRRRRFSAVAEEVRVINTICEGHGGPPGGGRRARARGGRDGGDRRAQLGQHHAPSRRSPRRAARARTTWRGPTSCGPEWFEGAGLIGITAGREHARRARSRPCARAIAGPGGGVAGAPSVAAARCRSLRRFCRRSCLEAACRDGLRYASLPTFFWTRFRWKPRIGYGESPVDGGGALTSVSEKGGRAWPSSSARTTPRRGTGRSRAPGWPSVEEGSPAWEAGIEPGMRIASA